MLYFLLHYHHHQFRDFLCLFLRPPVIKLDKAISILDLIPLLPKAAFLTGFSSEGEVFIFKKKKGHFKEMVFDKILELLYNQ